MRILHTSDWHLGRIMHGVHLTEDQAYVLEQFVQLVKEVKPDLVIVAGDVYDRGVPPIEAVELLDDVLSRLVLEGKVPVTIIAGNHDGRQRLGFGKKFMSSKGLHVQVEIGESLIPLEFSDKFGKVYVCPVPYVEPVFVKEKMMKDEKSAIEHQQALATMLSYYEKKIPEGCRSIAISHAFVAGSSESESERPLSVGGSDAVSKDLFACFNYTALGHLHNPQKAGNENIRYSGSLLKYSFSEAKHEKGVFLVEMDKMGDCQIEKISLTPRRDLRLVQGCLKDLLTSPCQETNKEDYLQITLEDEGPVYEAMNRLREIYPNVLHIERPYLLQSGEGMKFTGDHRKMGDLELFELFYQEVVGQSASEKEKDCFIQALESLKNGDE